MNIDAIKLSKIAQHFRDAIGFLSVGSITLGLANHLVSGDYVFWRITPHVHDIATGVVLYLATAGLTALAAANVALIVREVRG